MDGRKTLILFIWAVVSTYTSVCFAADSLSRKVPRALLVQLKTEQNRIKAITAAGDMKAVEAVQNDAKGVSTAMINDFTDNFDYCPVYYFLDINMDQVKSRSFKGVLMNADGSTVDQPVISDTSKNYFVVFYGYPESQSTPIKTASDQANTGQEMHRGLVVNNYKLQQVAFFNKAGYLNFLIGIGKNDKKYRYTSERFDIEYLPSAKQLNEKLHKRKVAK
jgi:hypothetical protein